VAGRIADRVQAALPKLIGALMSFLIPLLGLRRLVNGIEKLVSTVVDAIGGFVKKALSALFTLIKKLFGGGKPGPEGDGTCKIGNKKRSPAGQSGALGPKASARDELEEFAEKCCQVDPKPAIVARLVLAGGRAFEGKSSLVKVHAVIGGVYDELSTSARSVYHKKCAETDAISKALFAIEQETGVPITTEQQAKAILAGSTIQTALRKSLEPKQPCNSCAWPLIVFGITYSRAN